MSNASARDRTYTLRLSITILESPNPKPGARHAGFLVGNTGVETQRRRLAVEFSTTHPVVPVNWDTVLCSYT